MKYSGWTDETSTELMNQRNYLQPNKINLSCHQATRYSSSLFIKVK